MYENELYHWGILKQKWYHRRYQNPDGTWTQEGLERRRAARAAAQKKALAKARKTRAKNQAEKKKIEATRNKYKNNIVGMHAHRDLYTDDELKRARERYDIEKKIYDASEETKDRARKKLESAKNWVGTAVGMYEQLNKVYKIFNPDNKTDENSTGVKMAQQYAKDFIDSIGDTPYDKLDSAVMKKEVEALSNLATLERYSKGRFGGGGK